MASITWRTGWNSGAGPAELRLLVSPELREKFDRQRYRLNQAIWHGDLEAVRREASRMIAAWVALERAAVAARALVMSPEVWEVRLEDGSVAAIVRSPEEAHAVVASGRQLANLHPRRDRPHPVPSQRRDRGQAGLPWRNRRGGAPPRRPARRLRRYGGRPRRPHGRTTSLLRSLTP